MTKKNSIIFTCSNCGNQAFKWMGKCSSCYEWNTFVEEEDFKIKKRVNNDDNKQIPKKLNEIDITSYKRVKVGVQEFDRVLGGGLVEGSLILIGGEPGIGKSTLLTKVLSDLSLKIKDKSIFYISGEESQAQIAERAKRIGASSDSFYIFHESNWQNILREIKKNKPRFMVLDSIQTTSSDEISSPPGSVSQVREVTYELMNHVKENGITCFIVGHITKEGNIAGPKILEHMVDTVIYFEGDQYGHYRILRAIKNRFGNTNEIGVFEMKEEGLMEVKNPAQYFLEEAKVDAYGRSITCINEGSRSLFIEIQALVVENKHGNVRRTTQGVDNRRVSMLVAIVEKYLSFPMGFNDIYVNVVGNIKLESRESDLSILASLISSYKSKSISHDYVFLGEVGLTGEVRSVPNVESRIREMEFLKYKKLITSSKIARDFQSKSKIEIIGIDSVNVLSKII